MHQDPNAPDPQPFPSEADWLRLPLPDAAELPHDPRAFTDRTLAALRDERALDEQLAAIDRELPPLLWRSLRAPEPSPRFVARTLAAIADDRRARWQQLLARHVAPEPSPRFVARTLAALRSPEAAAPGPRDVLPGNGGGRRWLRWPLLAAAVLAVVWFGAERPAAAPLEARLVAASPAAFAHHLSASPLAAVLAVRGRAHDADGLVAASADGLWLQLARAR